MSRDNEGSFAGILVLISFVLGLFCLATSCTSVDTGKVGVVKHFGAVQGYTLPEGVHMTRPWPFADVTEVSTQNSTTDTEARAATKDVGVISCGADFILGTRDCVPQFAGTFGYRPTRPARRASSGL